MGEPAAERRVVRYRYGVLLTATMLSLLVQGIVPPGSLQQIVVTALAGASVTLAVRAAGVGPRVMTAGHGARAVRAGAERRERVHRRIGEGSARAMNAALVALGPPAVAIGLLRDLRVTGEVRIAAVMGVLALFILMGMLFAFIYGAIDHFGSDPFFAGGQPATTANCLYFSFTTLTTVGYGDFVARSDLGHTLSILEALIGQIYLVTVVS